MARETLPSVKALLESDKDFTGNCQEDGSGMPRNGDDGDTQCSQKRTQ